MYIEVIVTGTRIYSGKVISATSMRVAAQTTITSVAIVITPPAIGETAQTTIAQDQVTPEQLLGFVNR